MFRPGDSSVANTTLSQKAKSQYPTTRQKQKQKHVNHQHYAFWYDYKRKTYLLYWHHIFSFQNFRFNFTNRNWTAHYL